jgi:mRNA interferase RelE/StbE
MLPEAVEDLRDLDGAARKIIAAGIEKLRTDPGLRGAPLGSKASGNLSGLRKLVVGNRTYRIVYEVRADGTVVVLWVIGKRADSEVYALARSRVALYAHGPARQILNQLLDSAFED